MNVVDIIIPVYRGLAETRACIESVLNASSQQPMEVVVVDDASPEAAITQLLDDWSAAGKITLLRNATNRGFVASVNRAMALHTDRDVVLLNSDAEVYGNWLDRLVACAGSHPDAASLNPFSNNATLASYPCIGRSNELPEGWTGQRLDGLFASVNAGQVVDVPTSVGFCMFLRRSVLDKIGLFDEDAFGRGYGEENDWCMRATAKGYRHLLCGDIFVFHHGEVSFGADAKPGQQAAQAIVDARYPHYREVIARHFAEDPARAMRQNVDLARIAASPRPRLLFITHNWGGGTEKHVNDLACMISGKAEVLALRPLSGGQLALQWLCGEGHAAEPFRAYFEIPADEEALVGLLDTLGISRVHLHHIHQQPRMVLTLAARLGVPLDVTLHDYFPITPQYHLAPGGVVPETDVANAWGLSLAAWRDTMRTLLAGASRVICPSADLKERIAPYLPGINLEVWPHPEPDQPGFVTPRKVMVLGGLTVEKGLEVVRGCAADAAQRGLPLHFHVLGHTEHALNPDGLLPVSVHGSYAETELSRLIALAAPDAFLFPAQIPESFSYTLTAARRTGLPIVASRLGAFSERLAGYPGATLVDWNADPNHWNDTLLAVAPKQETVPPVSGNTAEYSARYLAPLMESPVARGRDAGSTAGLAARFSYPARHLASEPEKSLEQLVIGGVECGHRPTREELKRRAKVFDAEIRQARDSAQAAHDAMHRIEADLMLTVTELQAALAEQDKAVAAARDAYLAIEESTSWRITAPLRNVMQRVKDWRLRLSDLRRGLQRLPRDAAIAGQILKEEGVVALGKRVHDKLTRHNDFAGGQGKVYEAETAITALAVPASDAPRWSLIIPVYQQHLLTFTCLKSIADTCADAAIEVIVIDDCSPEPVTAALATVSGIRVIRNETNLGFLKNCNKAAAEARGEFVVILNNDLILTGDWLRQMTAVFDRWPDTGMVGAKLIYPDGKLQEAGGIVWRDGSAWNVGRGDDPDKPEYSYVREVDYCSGACLMLRRAFWNELGGFDEAYVPAYYEDTDLAFKVRAKGKRVFYQPHAVVVHFEGQSSGTDVTQGVKRHQVINQKTFAERWRPQLANHRLNGLSPRLEKDRGARRRVLVIDACMLTPDQDAGSLRMLEVLGVMRNLGCKVTFVASNLEYRLPYVRDIQALGVEVLHHPYVTSIPAVIEQGAAEYNVVMLSRATVAVKYVDLVREKMPGAKLIFDTVDLHFLRESRRADLSGDEAHRKSALAMQATELDIIAKSDVTLVVSDFEQKLLEEMAPRARVSILATIHDPMPGPASFAERSGMIFIGGFRHPPNLDAVTWFAEHVLPILRRKAPGIVTTVIGSNAPPALEKFAAADFVIAGFVPDVAPYYQHARLSISPLRYGAGIKGKVSLAMQYGVPVVATTVSVEGMYLTPEQDVLVADDAEGFADAIIRLNSDEALWQRLRQGGIENLEARFSTAAARRALSSLLDLEA